MVLAFIGSTFALLVRGLGGLGRGQKKLILGLPTKTRPKIVGFDVLNT